jgi:hypothetical protein
LRSTRRRTGRTLHGSPPSTVTYTPPASSCIPMVGTCCLLCHRARLRNHPSCQRKR